MKIDIKGQIVLIDEADWDRVREYVWWVSQNNHCRKKLINNSTYYAYAKMGGKNVAMHRLILGHIPQGLETDHINGNGLDNRKMNLRTCTHSQNNRNKPKMKGTSSKYIGVSWHIHKNKWIAKIQKNGKAYYLGYFDSQLKAAIVRDRHAKYILGEYAKLIFA
jgi:hypothetical protein